MRFSFVCRSAAVLLLFGFATLLQADIVYLKNGDKLKGKIVSQDEKKIVLETPFATLAILKSKITNVVREYRPDEPVNLYLKNGSIYRGVVVKRARLYLMIQRANGQRKIFLKENIERLDWKKNVKEKIVIPSSKKIGPKKNNGKNGLDKFGKMNGSNKNGGSTQKKEPGKNKPQKDKIERLPLGLFNTRFKGMSTEQLRWQAAWRSAVLPSWGQFYQGYTTKGLVFAGAMGVSLLGMLFSYLDYRSEKDKWDAGDHGQAQYDRMKRSSDLYFVFSLSAFSVWLLNVLDAAIFSPELPVARDAKFSLMPDPGSGAFCLQFEKRF